jgi:ABC-2 type transport system ATP-binding protein
MIRTFDISKNYGRYQAVNNVNLCIKPNEIFGFLGLNGAGKTTFLRMICGLLRPSSGYAQFDELEVRGPQDLKKLIPILSFVSQEMKLYESATLREVFPIYAGLASSSPERGFKFATQVDLPLDRPCNRLSPGQQRKAQLAIALMKNPRYLVLDEPTAGLDPKGVAEIRETIKIMQREGKTIILSSHILGEVQSICTSVGILHLGQIHFQGPLNVSFHIEIHGDIKRAAQILNTIDVSPTPTNTGLQIDIKQEEIPALTSKLNAEGITTGLIEPVSLESIFNGVIEKSEVEL